MLYFLNTFGKEWFFSILLVITFCNILILQIIKMLISAAGPYKPNLFFSTISHVPLLIPVTRRLEGCTGLLGLYVTFRR